MKARKLWIWLGGWSLEVEQVEAFAQKIRKDKSHLIIPPNAAWKETLAKREGEGERIIAYSLGAFLLLLRSDCPWERIILLAPFLQLTQPDWGGKVKNAELQRLERQVKRNPQGAVEGFYRQHQLDWEVPKKPDVEALLWGLEIIGKQQATLPDKPPLACVGERDSLVDAGILKCKWENLFVLEKLGHDLKAFGPWLEKCIP